MADNKKPNRPRRDRSDNGRHYRGEIGSLIDSDGQDISESLDRTNGGTTPVPLPDVVRYLNDHYNGCRRYGR